MRRVMMTSLVVTALFVMHGLAAAQDPAKALDEAWAKAAKAGDVEAIVALYAPDAVLYPPDAMEACGTAAIRKSISDLLNMWTVQDMTMAVTYHTAGDTSISTGRFKMVLVPKAGGPPGPIDGRVTMVARKIGTNWLIVSDHASAPLPPQEPR